MRDGHIMKGMQGFMALHQRTVEADFASASRREAERMRLEIASAQASGVLGIDQATLYRKRKRIGLE